MTVSNDLDKDDLAEVRRKVADVKVRQLEVLAALDHVNTEVDSLAGVVTKDTTARRLIHNLRIMLTVTFIAIMMFAGAVQYGVLNPNVTTTLLDKGAQCTAVVPDSCTEFSGLGFKTKICNNTSWVTIMMLLTLLLGTYGGVKFINQIFPSTTARRRKGDKG